MIEEIFDTAFWISFGVLWEAFMVWSFVSLQKESDWETWQTGQGGYIGWSETVNRDEANVNNARLVE